MSLCTRQICERQIIFPTSELILIIYFRFYAIPVEIVARTHINIKFTSQQLANVIAYHRRDNYTNDFRLLSMIIAS